jgi:IS6 family transposase
MRFSARTVAGLEQVGDAGMVFQGRPQPVREHLDPLGPGQGGIGLVDQQGQVIDVLVPARRDLAAARRFLASALRVDTIPAEVTTDRAPVYPRVLDELVPSALHVAARYANNPVEADHGRLKARLRPMRGLKRHRSARFLAAGHAFIQNLRRGHYEIVADAPARHRLRIALQPRSHHLTRRACGSFSDAAQE